MSEKKLYSSGICPICKKDNSFEATDTEMTGFDKYLNRKGDIQNIMPFLSAEKREVLISGICLSCQNKVFNVSRPEDIECDLNRLGYVLDVEENNVVRFINEENKCFLQLDYNIMAAYKLLIKDEFMPTNGNYEEMTSEESQILRHYGFGLAEDLYDDDWDFDWDDDDDLPF